MYNLLNPFKIINAGDMSLAFLTSTVVDIKQLHSVVIQMIFTGTPTGTFSIQGSLNYDPNILGSGTWTALSVVPAPAAAGVAGDILVELATAIPYIRVVYTRGAGAGSLDVYLSGKVF
jgi:hypothetical protein